MVSRRLALVILCASTALAGCMPASGPGADVIDKRASASGIVQGYRVVDLDASTAASLAASSGRIFGGSLPARPAPPAQRIGVGDTVQVSVFESSPGGLFSPPAGSITTGSRQQVLPNQTVDQDGTIEIPYGGRIRAAGKTPAQISREAEAAVKDRAVEPKVIVTVVEQAAGTATVLGEVTGAGKVKLGVRGERLLSVIAMAGGVRAPEHEVQVRLVRNGSSATVPLRALTYSSEQNVWVYPDDTIYVLRQPLTFSAFGAVSRQGTFSLDSDAQTLSEALGKAGGLNDARADIGGVFLFRYSGGSPGRGTPTVYRIRFSDPRSYLWLQTIKVRDKDVLYVANAPSVEIEKFIGMLRGGIGLGLQAGGAAAGM